VNVTRWQLKWAVWAIEQDIDLCRATRSRVRPEVRDVLQQLKDLLAMSTHGHESVSSREELDLTGPKAVAAELGCTPRHVGRIAGDIGGQLVEGHWVFRRKDVEDFKAWKDTGRDRS
jgi:hypothetical protein